MLKQEFEQIVKTEVTEEQYNAIEILYMNTELDKYEFIKSIKGLIKSLNKMEKKNRIITVSIPDRSGYYKTPNGCWHHLIDVEVITEIDFDIKTGKVIKPQVKTIENSYRTSNVFDCIDYEVEFIN